MTILRRTMHMSTFKSLLLAGTIALAPLGAQAMASPKESAKEAPSAEIVEPTIIASPEGSVDITTDADSEATAAESKAKMQREMDEAVAMVEKIFDTSDLPAIEPARLTLAEQTTRALVAPGSLERMIDNLYGKMFSRFMKEFDGTSDLMISIKTGVESDEIAKLDEKSKAAIADMFDPHRKDREDQITKIIKPLISEALADVERPMQGGLAKAYARKFSAGQLTDLNGFLATPTGKAYAQEWMALQADPEVMLAVVKAMPPLVNKFIDRAPTIEADMKDLPQDRALADLSEAELKKLAKLMKVKVKVLKDHRDLWSDTAAEDAVAVEAATDVDYATTAVDAAADAAVAATDVTTDYEADAIAAAKAAADAAGADNPAYDRSNWSAADLKRVEELEVASDNASLAAQEAAEEAIENARKKLPE